MNEYRQTEEWIRRTRPDIEPGKTADRRILSDAGEAMQAVNAGRSEDPSIAGRIFMKNTMKIAAGIIIVIGVSLVFLFNSSGNTIALAAVYAKMQQAQAYMYQMHMTMTGNAEATPQADGKESMQMEMVITMSSEYGMKMENQITAPGPQGQPQKITQLVYQKPDEKTMISIIPEQKVYQKVELTDKMAEKTRAQNNDAREIIKQMLDCKYESLGPSELNGVKVQGFQTTDPAYGDGMGTAIKATLWVDAETWLPYYLEFTMEMGDLMKIDATADNFQWDIAAAAEDFAVVIPEDYKELESLAVSEINADNLKEKEARMRSMTNIKQLLLAGLMQANDKGQWPETLAALAASKPELLVNPAHPGDPEGYVYLKPEGKWPEAQAVVIYEKHEQWGDGINVGFGDGHVEFMAAEAEFIKRLNPPSTE